MLFLVRKDDCSIPTPRGAHEVELKTLAQIADSCRANIRADCNGRAFVGVHVLQLQTFTDFKSDR
jgi:hypothetical protein